MEKQTKNPKRMLLYSILAITLGIATILPLSYLTLATATNEIQPFFTPNMMYINAIPHTETLYEEPYMTIIYPDGTVHFEEIPDTGTITVCVCYDITPNGADLKNVDAKIEVYNFHFYSDQGSILNMTQSVAIVGNVLNPNSPNGVTSAIAEWDEFKNTYIFADGTVFEFTNVLGYIEDSAVGYWTIEGSTATKGHQMFGSWSALSESDGEKTAQALTDLRNAQTIYVDVTRVLQVTYKHSSSPNVASVITATPTSNEVLCHIELSPLDNMGRATYDNDKRNDHEKYLAIESPMDYIQ